MIDCSGQPGRRRTVAAVAMAVLLFLVGCGFKDKPVPPRQVVPKPVLDLRAELDDKGAILTWRYPNETVTGRELEAIDSFALYRAEILMSDYCPTCPVPYGSPISLAGGLVPPEGGRTATYEVRNLRPDHLYFFKVRSRTGWWSESEDSNEISLYWQTPPATPQALSALGGDGSTTLQWQASAPAAGGLIRYQLHRGVDGSAITLLGEPVAATTYTDTAVETGRVYAYQVQALAVFTHGTVRSGLSEAVEAKPVDRTAPPVPDRVEALRTEVGVKVFWDQVDAPDLAGYRIYRRAAGETKAIRVGEVNLPQTLFVDEGAPAVPLFYSVSSIDTRSPANESPRSSEIRLDN